MTRFLVAVALGLATLVPGVVGQAFAADLPEPVAPPPRAPATYIPTVAPVYNWSGIYFGVNGGYGFGKSDWTQAGASTGSFNTSGYAFGAGAGANFQADAFVFGIEADFDGMGLDGTASCLPTNCETRDSWLATLRGRAGYAVDRVLFYGTAGGAFGNIQANTANSTSFQSTSKAGWTAGAGVEAAFADNWTARIEYLFVDLQDGSFGSPAGGPISVKFDANLIRVGVNYKFR
jgi:outer membrane immunogenic protein